VNLALRLADFTENYAEFSTYANEAYVKRGPMIDIIYECEISNYKLIAPISVTIEPDHNDFVAHDSLTGIYSFGDTAEEAKINFCYSLEDVYEFLLEDSENLTQLNKDTLSYLNKILIRK
jgi:predicted RNase H-like HicB family nuclease